jgi:nitroimidazol reductase NimA-like FMN-containing flavoprotein (pyridoxamine 5'-phosphate oxidase superfamily)
VIGNLNSNQVNEMLHKEVVGRIGCFVNDTIYIVPISYAYDGESVYAHTHEGLKLQAMRKNPAVCFEVDDYKDMSNWQSVIAWGKFEEIINEADRNKALELLLNRSLPLLSSVTTHLGKSWPFYSDQLEAIEGIVFRIVLEKTTGRFESTSNSPHVNG